MILFTDSRLSVHKDMTELALAKSIAVIEYNGNKDIAEVCGVRYVPAIVGNNGAIYYPETVDALSQWLMPSKPAKKAKE